MFTASHRFIVARVALALMLFAQAAMAWSTCEWSARAPERAVRAAEEHAGCENMSAGQGGFSGTCLAHCLSENQSLDRAVLDVPAMPAAPVLTVVLPRDALLDGGIAKRRDSAPGTGPPRRILLQSFQI
ncbi:MAG: hypothetical protein HY017_27160 [Betaproteobacteria bacterium]|nr:hypothetical protein [Betaproteobacteria bacterium]